MKTFEIINDLEKKHKSITVNFNGQSKKLRLYKDFENGFLINHYHNRLLFNYNSDLSDIKIATHNNDLFIIKAKYKDYSTLTINNFYSESFTKEESSQFRLLIPVKSKIFIDHFIQQNISQDIVIEYINLNISLYQHETEPDKSAFLIFESLSAVSLNTFEKYCFSIIISLNYIIGNICFNEGYFFSYNINDFETPKSLFYSKLISGSHSIFSPLGNVNLFSPIRKFTSESQPMSSAVFSKLCQWSNDSSHFSSVLQLIIEARSASLAIMPSGFFVALEGITTLINTSSISESKNQVEAKQYILGNFIENLEIEMNKYNEKAKVNFKDIIEEEKQRARIVKKLLRQCKNMANSTIIDFNEIVNNEKSIKDKIVKKYIKYLEVLIEKETQKLGDFKTVIEEFKVSEKINNLLRKPKNRDVFTNIFSELDIILSEYDEKSLDKRNYFLHGNISLTAKTDKEIDNNNILLYAMNVYTLLNALILKSIGYDGKILDWHKIFLKLEEDYTRNIN
ncbi:hypothetical protein [Larkinella punicea]|uniref:hypothetical protein n=1 Tax=Larkinella punicea TaxID=2315727 RepID=UPI001402E394|nr:hypothetical protein [Larkinella punicea]